MSSKKQKIDVQALQKEYENSVAITRNFCDEVKGQINKLLEDEKITLGFPIQGRVKTWDSLAEKFERISLNVEKITDVQDLVGFRIILLFKRDVERVRCLLTDYLTVTKQYNTNDRLKEDQFGYSSTHLIVKLPHSWLFLPTFKNMGDFQAEIQIRTVAQHMWAEASHKLQYKHEESVPISLRRAIYRVSALLETVDLEFERIIYLKSEYRTNAPVADDTALNVDNLELILKHFLPSKNYESDDEYEKLLQLLIRKNIFQAKQLADLVNKNIDEVIAYDKGAVKYYNEMDGDLYWYPHHRVHKGYLLSHVGMVAEMLSQDEDYDVSDFSVSQGRFYFPKEAGG